MRFVIMHTTNAHWEASAKPSPELIARVGALLQDLAARGLLLGAEGLRATAHGARLRVSGGVRTVTRGPFVGEHELPSAFTILRAASLDDAVEWATREAAALGDVEIDVRPITEPWDLGLADRPEGLSTQRFMLLRKATAASEAGRSPGVDLGHERGVHLVSEVLRPSARGRRLRREDVRVLDGPFTESKELLAGYVIIRAESLDEATEWARRYLEVVDAEEVDVRELE